MSEGFQEALTVSELDGSPSIRNVTELVVDSGTATNLGGGRVRLNTGSGGGGGGSGSVTSVGLTMPAIFSVASSPITDAGTIAVTLATQTANRVWAGPTTGSAATPTFRALVAADLPSVSLSSGITGTLPILNGGTGATTATLGFDALSPMSAVGDTIYGGTAGTRTRLAGNATAVRMFLRQTGSGSASAAPTWDTLLAADLPNAVSDGSTKGVATFVPADFTDSGGVIGIDYPNGVAASASNKGFVTAADWLTFNGKVSPINGGLEVIDTTHGSMGAAETFSLSAGNWHTGTLNANCTFTISGWTNGFGCTLFLGLTQDATGGRTITWPAAVVNSPQVSTTANAITWISLWSIDGGTTIYASTPVGVAAGAVTSSGLTMATSRILGRTTASTGAVEELTISAVLDLAGSTRGSVLYRGASGWTILVPGTAGFALTSGGTGADPTWTATSGDVTAAATFTTDNAVIRADGTAKGVQASTTFIADNGAISIGDATSQTGNYFFSILSAAVTEYAFRNSGFANPFTTFWPTADVFGDMGNSDSYGGTNHGGVFFDGFTSATASAGLRPLSMQGYHGPTNPDDDTGAVAYIGSKHDGAGSNAALADAETILELINLATTKVRVRGNGDIQSAGILRTAGGVTSDITAVNSVSPTSPNRTVTIKLNGTTYYLAAKTTND